MPAYWHHVRHPLRFRYVLARKVCLSAALRRLLVLLARAIREPPGSLTVAIASWNSLEFLPTTLDAVRTFSSPDVRLLVIDNASTDGSREYLRRRRDVDLVPLPVNVYHGPALDLAFLLARTEFVISLDVDAFPLSSVWLDRLVAPLRDGYEVSGVRGARDRAHPSCLAMRRRRFLEQGHTFAGNMSGETLGVDCWDTGELITIRERPRVFTFERTDRPEPGPRGFLGSVYEPIVFHNAMSMRHRELYPDGADLPADRGLHRSDVQECWRDAVGRFLDADPVTILEESSRSRCRTGRIYGARLGVVVPCCDATYLGECLASLQAAADRLGEPVPVVVVDDGSPGKAASSIAQQFGHKVVRHEAPTGVAHARNAGIRRLSAEWVLSFDADDVCEPTLLLELHKAIQRARPATGILYTRALQFGSRTGPMNRRLPWWELKNTNFVGSHVTFRRDAWGAVGGYDRLAEPREDWEFALAVVARGWRTAMIPIPLWRYRVHGSNISILAAAAEWERARQYIEQKHQAFIRTRHDMHPRAAVWRVEAKARQVLARQRERRRRGGLSSPI